MKKITNTNISTSNTIIDLAFLPTGKTWQPNSRTDKRFIESGEHLVNHLAKAIDDAKEFICFTSFIFQDGKIVKAMEKAIQRGVKVFVLTSDIRVSQQSVYDNSDEEVAVSGFKDLLNKRLRNKALVRMANNIHAKYLLIDPKSPNSQGFLATCNFTEKATKENPELVAVLNENETTELFKTFVWHFWEGTTDEQNKKDIKKVNPIERFEMPKLNTILQTSTRAKQTTIRDYTLEIIQSAKSKIIFSSFGFDVSHELGKALLEKCKNGVEVVVLARNRAKVFNGNLDKLAKAGAKIFTHDLLHAKFIAVDNEKGAIFTANFEKYGMDEGVEVGLKLEKKDVEALLKIAERWQNTFSHRIEVNVKLTDLPENYFTMKQRGLEAKTIERNKKKSKTVKLQDLNEAVQIWSKKQDFNQNEIKKYEFELTLNLEEKEIEELIEEKELTPNIYFGKYQAEQKKGKKVGKVTKEAIFVTDDVKFDNFLSLSEYRKLPIFVLTL